MLLRGARSRVALAVISDVLGARKCTLIGLKESRRRFEHIACTNTCTNCCRGPEREVDVDRPVDDVRSEAAPDGARLRARSGAFRRTLGLRGPRARGPESTRGRGPKRTRGRVLLAVGRRRRAPLLRRRQQRPSREDRQRAASPPSGRFGGGPATSSASRGNSREGWDSRGATGDSGRGTRAGKRRRRSRFALGRRRADEPGTRPGKRRRREREARDGP